jgi:hypothetical protein
MPHMFAPNTVAPHMFAPRMRAPRAIDGEG